MRKSLIKELLRTRLNIEDTGKVSLSFDAIGDTAVIKFQDEWVDKGQILAGRAKRKLLYWIYWNC